MAQDNTRLVNNEANVAVVGDIGRVGAVDVVAVAVAVAILVPARIQNPGLGVEEGIEDQECVLSSSKGVVRIRVVSKDNQQEQ